MQEGRTESEELRLGRWKMSSRSKVKARSVCGCGRGRLELPELILTPNQRQRDRSRLDEMAGNEEEPKNLAFGGN